MFYQNILDKELYVIIGECLIVKDQYSNEFIEGYQYKRVVDSIIQDAVYVISKTDFHKNFKKVFIQIKDNHE